MTSNALPTPKLISDHYREQNRLLHKQHKKYGSGSFKEAPYIRRLQEKYQIKSVLDYGSGKGTLKGALNGSGLDFYEYDPALNIDERRPCDLVVCRDVMEHVEPDYVDAVILDLHRLTIKVLYAVIATSKSGDVLPDGRNAHLIIQPGNWWTEKLVPHFDILKKTVDEKHKAVYELAPKLK